MRVRVLAPPSTATPAATAAGTVHAKDRIKRIADAYLHHGARLRDLHLHRFLAAAAAAVRVVGLGVALGFVAAIVVVVAVMLVLTMADLDVVVFVDEIRFGLGVR